MGAIYFFGVVRNLCFYFVVRILGGLSGFVGGFLSRVCIGKGVGMGFLF